MKHLPTKYFKIWSLLLCLFIVIAAVPLQSAKADEPGTTIRIVHTNDIHGYYTSVDKKQIGFSALKALIDEQSADLVLDIGDTFHGQAFATIDNGESIARLMDAVGYDAMTPGNHDWTYGAAQLKKLDTDHSFAILAANVKNSNGDSYFAAPYLVKQVTADDGTALKVGVVGVIDDSFYESTLAENVTGLTFGEEAAQATQTAAQLRNDLGCDIVIAITHQSDCQGFVASIKGIDAVIAGHDHVLLDTTYTDADNKSVPVVEAGYYFLSCGVLSLTYDKASATITDATETVYTAADTAAMSDSTVTSLISDIENSQSATLNATVGNSAAAYPYSWEDIRVSELPIGRIVTAAYLDWTGADVAMENAGGIRAGIPEGTITYKNLISISPYGNVLVVKSLQVHSFLISWNIHLR